MASAGLGEKERAVNAVAAKAFFDGLDRRLKNTKTPAEAPAEAYRIKT